MKRLQPHFDHGDVIDVQAREIRPLRHFNSSLKAILVDVIVYWVVLLLLPRLVAAGVCIYMLVTWRSHRVINLALSVLFLLANATLLYRF